MTVAKTKTIFLQDYRKGNRRQKKYIKNGNNALYRIYKM